MIPQCKKYQQMLANENLKKKKFISYIMDQFIKFGMDSDLSVNIILDYEDIECPCSMYKRSKVDLEMLKNKNKNGEADYNIWYH